MILHIALILAAIVVLLLDCGMVGWAASNLDRMGSDKSDLPIWYVVLTRIGLLVIIYLRFRPGRP